MPSSIASSFAYLHQCMLSVIKRYPISSAIAATSSLYALSTVVRSSPATFSSSPFKLGSKQSRDMSNYPKGKSEQEWQAVLSPEQFRILRKKGTEMAGSGEYDGHYPQSGFYECAGCGTPLYKAETKFKSGCGWPAFYEALPGAVEQHSDRSFGMERIEITCASCGGHLGHLFKGEGFPTPTDERACVNSVSIKFKDGDMPNRDSKA